MFSEKLALVPHKPGSYQMKNKDGLIIYVGKAKDLKNRLKSYFTGTHTGKTKMLVENIADFEYIVTSTELESLILEITLIKKYNPKYNILLKDDKSYPYIELSNDLYPTLKVVRNTKKKKNKGNLYGPFPNATAARKTVEIINRVYPLRKCSPMQKKLCLYYHIGQCLGYCEKDINEYQVKKMKDEIISFLKGDSSKITEKLEFDMQKASESLNYEKAQELKETLDDINITLKKQKIDLNHSNYNIDLFNYYRDDNYLSIQIFFIRGGVLFGRDKKIFNIVGDTTDEITSFIINFYEKHDILPKEILVPKEINSNLIEKYLNIKVHTPVRGQFRKLMDLAYENAKDILNEKQELLKLDEKKKEEALNDLKSILKQNNVSRIEAFDNSHLFGTFYVGGMVVFEDFKPLKNEYRKYRISTEVKDDLSAMKEVVYRRYYKVLMEDLEKPDIIIADGGETQVKVIKDIIDALNLNITVIGLKKDNKHRTSSLINSNLETIPIKKDSNLFLFLTMIQDEVHNYAINYHRNIKTKGSLSSVLDMIPGIGENRKKELLKRFGSLKKLKEASIEELKELLPENIAKNTFNYLKNML